ncbi:pitrilysin family protein [Methylococcus sp. EFPC2]|uniref:M16 family metallopeptidase n=1 Tax=Methylococcus sp. EFPC2 TaxID=2812648 RepID=UPI0019687979|nr:pitrilysin family protein [Methylococcus sp. EFPC2]QSA98779.1 insulinase family protein [Methylococcus sp. EFPC2]
MYVNTRIIFLAVFLSLWTAWAHAGPKIQTWTTPNGSRVYYVPTEGLPLVDVRVVFDAGSARDGAQYGLATLTSGLLDTGAGEWNADAIAQRLEGVGARLSTGVSRDSAWLSLRTLTDTKLLDTALSTAREILAKPTFSETDFEREKKNLLLALKQREESPGDLAGIAFFQALYGDHPYAHPKDGDIATVDKLTRDDLRKFYQRYYVANNALVVIVGEVDKTQAESIADRLLSDLPKGEVPPNLPTVSQPQSAQTLRKTFPSEQTHIYSGLPSVRVADPDYFPLYVGNHILGGSGLVSRISEEVREKRGLSYSAYSYFYPFRVEGPFMLGLQTRNDQADQALQVLLDTLREFIAHGPTAKELEASKKNIIGGFALRLDSNQKLAEQVAAIASYGLPLDYLDTFIGKVEAVTAHDIQRAFQSRINPDRLQTILVGAGQSREK